MVTGFYGNNCNIPITGISVSRKKHDQEELVYSVIQKTAALLEIKQEIPREAVSVYDDYVGPGYSLPTPEMVEAVQLLARTEGILLDPVYTGKAMSGLIGLVRKGFFKKDQMFYSYILVVLLPYMLTTSTIRATD